MTRLRSLLLVALGRLLVLLLALGRLVGALPALHFEALLAEVGVLPKEKRVHVDVTPFAGVLAVGLGLVSGVVALGLGLVPGVIAGIDAGPLREVGFGPLDHEVPGRLTAGSARLSNL